MGEKIKVALVGCGGMARLYRSIYTKIEGAELYMLIDSNEETAKKAALELGVERYSTTFENCLQKEVDMVDISTPNFLHKQQAIAAIKAGKSVLIQKPVTVNVDEAREIAKAQKESGARVGVYMELRSHAVYNEVKDIIEKGLLGTVTSTRARKAYPTGLTIDPKEWRCDIAKTGGGAFIQLGVHCMDICMWLINERITSLCAYSENNLCGNMGGDDSTAVIARYESGIYGVFEAGYNSYGRKTEIYGTKGSIIVNEPESVTVEMEEAYEGDIIKYTPGGRKTFETHFSREALNSIKNPYEQHVAFVNAIIEGKEAPVDFSVGLYDMQLIEAVYKSARERKYINF